MVNTQLNNGHNNILDQWQTGREHLCVYSCATTWSRNWNYGYLKLKTQKGEKRTDLSNTLSNHVTCYCMSTKIWLIITFFGLLYLEELGTINSFRSNKEKNQNLSISCLPLPWTKTWPRRFPIFLTRASPSCTAHFSPFFWISCRAYILPSRLFEAAW